MFHHNPDHNSLRAALETTPKDFSKWKSPTGGDQIFARKLSGGVWGKPIAVTAGGGDLYRSAIAVDGQGRAWVFWAQNVKPAGGRANFEIFARVIQNDAPGAQVQISNDPGSDIDPVAATDAGGNVWVAWQGWRNGKAAIFAASQSGDKFSAPAAVSQSAGNEWNPAIAADKTRARHGGVGFLSQPELRRLSAHGCRAAHGGRRRRWRPVRAMRLIHRSPTTAAGACGWRTRKAARDGARTSELTTPTAWRCIRGA